MSRPRRGRKHLIAMVGLPARGKTFTARKLVGYLGWLGYPTRSFNVGERRRAELGAGQTHEFFAPGNREAAARRQALAEDTLADALAFLGEGGRIAIFDATNGTRARRIQIAARCRAADVDLLFVELENDDPVSLEESMREAKLSSPDYAGVPVEAALADFRARIAHYEAGYERLSEADGSWVRLERRGQLVVIHDVHGWIPGRIVSFLTNLQVTRRPIWLTRHGESTWNVEGRIGGDAPLSARGHAYAKRLAEYVREHAAELPDLDVWTSTLRRARETAAPLGLEAGDWRALDEIDAGSRDGLRYDEIERRFPDEHAARTADKLRFRYPRGESYEDVVQRLDRVIVELERYRTPVLVIAHRAVLRVLYAYFRQLPIEQAPHVEMPLHTIVKLTPTAYGCLEERVTLEV